MCKKIALTAAALAALGAGGAAVARRPDAVSGRCMAPRVGQARPAITGGTANSVERDGENGATWEVEVTKPDGQTVDVRLDQAYKLVVIEADGEESGGSGA